MNYYNNSLYENNLKFNEKRKLKTTSTCVGAALVLLSIIYEVLDYFRGGLIRSFFGLSYFKNDAIHYSISGTISILGMMLPAIFLIIILKEPVNNLIAAKKVPVKNLIAMVFVGLSICMASNFLTMLLSNNLSYFGYQESTSTYKSESSVLGIIMNLAAVALTPALVEEFLFRGVILGSLRKFGDSLAVFLSALMFGLCHSNITQSPFAFILGLVFGYLTVYTNSILPSMLIHMLNNLYSTGLTIIYNNCNSTVYFIIYVSVTCLIVLAGVISFIYLIKNNHHFGTLEKANDDVLSFKEKIKTVFSSLMLLFSALVFIVQAAMEIIRW